VALRRTPCALSAALKQQRHITPNATDEIKLDGYRMIAVRNDKPELYSRLKNSNTRKLPEIATALTSLPHGSVIDGELVAIDNDGRPDFNLLQNYRSSEAHLVYFAFDILAHKGKSLLELSLVERRKILRDVVIPDDRVQLVEASTNAEHIVRSLLAVMIHIAPSRCLILNSKHLLPSGEMNRI
jgi:ATP-dependent DNA ligase